MKTYKNGLIIGRFQPFHNGHLYLVKKSLQIADKLIVGVGSSNRCNRENPLSFIARKKIISIVFEKEGIEKKLIKIVALPDVPNDSHWLEMVRKRVGAFDVLIGNNAWTNGIFEKVGIPIVKAAMLKRNLYQGKVVRKYMALRKNIEKLVPAYLLPLLL